MRTKFWILPISVATLGLAAVAFFYSPSSTAAPGVTWTPSSVTQTVVAGQTKTTIASFTTSENLSNLVVWVVPELRTLVQATPAQFASVTKGQAVTLTLTTTVPITASPATLDGTIHLRVGSRTIAKPLPITLIISGVANPAEWPVYRDLSTGISFRYPTFGRGASVEALPNTDGSRTFVAAVQIGTKLQPQYGITTRANSNGETLSAWFSRNVDMSGTLLASGAFRLEQYPNGVTAYVRVPSAPTTGTGEPVDEAYAMSASGNTIIAIARGHDNDLSTIGVDDSLLISAYRNILSTFVAP